MANLLHELIIEAALTSPENEALTFKQFSIDYQTLAQSVEAAARGFVAAGLQRQERLAIYLPKQFETVFSIFGATAAGGVFVPVNPLLKAPQVAHILRDCDAKILVTTGDRLGQLAACLDDCHDLHTVVIVGAGTGTGEQHKRIRHLAWDEMRESRNDCETCRVIDSDIASIFYTSGSTGKPKGVVLSHRNMVAGAESVAQYLSNRSNDRLLAVLPLSFDYGFSQLSTAFKTGASVVLMDYLFPRDVIQAVEEYRITGLAGVPPLWIQLAKLEWPQAAAESLRYITNSGGAMPVSTIDRLKACLPQSQIFLMYGLTEAFRSTFLAPEELHDRPDSMGKAIPNADILVVREDGTECAPGEPGELVHRGALVAQGYWNDPEKTALRFRPSPRQETGTVMPEIAVWSGDTVKRDADGYLYFVGRRDDMIKTSGYRISPSEIEESVYSTGLVAEVAAIGVPHSELGQAIVIVAVPTQGKQHDTDELLTECRRDLPNFMVPSHIEWREELPRNPNGKVDRTKIRAEMQELFRNDAP